MGEGQVLTATGNNISLMPEVDPEFEDYVKDLIEYGLAQFNARYTNEDEFLMWQDYRQDQVLLKILDNPKHNQKGTYYKNNEMFIFAGLKKDANVQDHLKYNDKFLNEEIFQWESVARISESEVMQQQLAKHVHVFVRKVKEENGITLPFTYVGIGHLQNARKNVTTNGSILYDIKLDKKVPQSLYEDFKWVE